MARREKVTVRNVSRAAADVANLEGQCWGEGERLWPFLAGCEGTELAVNIGGFNWIARSRLAQLQKEVAMTSRRGWTMDLSKVRSGEVSGVGRMRPQWPYVEVLRHRRLLNP